MKCWKIVERYQRGFRTLFHGVDGSRHLEPGLKLICEEKLVSDGTSKTRYLSGWHVLKSETDALEYLKSFTERLDKLAVIPVEAWGLRPKEHSRQPVFLARSIRLPVRS